MCRVLGEGMASNEAERLGRSQELLGLGDREFMLRMMGSHWRV